MTMMTKFENGKKYALIAAICLLPCAFLSLVGEGLFFSIGYFCMAITLFMKTPKFVIASVGGNLLFSAFPLAYWLFADYAFQYNTIHFVNFVVYALIAVNLVLSLKGLALIKKIWFLPAILNFLSVLMCLFWILEHLGMFVEQGIQTVAVLFVGMWLSKNVPAPAKDYAQFNPSVDDEAARLTKLKELLDAGILTQEEYDDKKKQILGL